MDGLPIRGVMWMLGLMVLNALTEAMITALDNVSDSGIRKKAEEGNRRAKMVCWLLEHHRRYITVTDLVCVSSIAGMTLAYWHYLLGEIMFFLRENIVKIEPVVVFLTVCVSLLVLMFVELFSIKLPKKIAFKHAEGYALAFSGFLWMFVKLLGPVAWAIETVTLGLLGLFHIKASELEESVTEEELISTVAEAQENGVLEAEEAEMIHNIFDFDATQVNEIMTHRKNIVAVDADWTLEKAMHFMLGEIYSRFPVYEDSLENIVGILHLKDVTRIYVSEPDKAKECSVRSVIREPYFVPDAQSLDVLFHDMQTKKIHMAFAIDEYGQTAGLVTMEDMLEEIVGEIQDEYDKEEDDIVENPDGSLLVKGITNLDDLSEVLGIDLTGEEFDTLNGLMVSELGYIPMEEEKTAMVYRGCRLEIVEVKNKIISLAKVTKLPVETEEIKAAE